jgi:hypothetical protein
MSYLSLLYINGTNYSHGCDLRAQSGKCYTFQGFHFSVSDKYFFPFSSSYIVEVYHMHKLLFFQNTVTLCKSFIFSASGFGKGHRDIYKDKMRRWNMDRIGSESLPRVGYRIIASCIKFICIVMS